MPNPNEHDYRGRPKGELSREELRNTWKTWAERCLEEGLNLSNWETKFCESQLEHLQRGWVLTREQATILERIYTEKVP